MCMHISSSTCEKKDKLEELSSSGLLFYNICKVAKQAGERKFNVIPPDCSGYHD